MWYSPIDGDLFDNQKDAGEFLNDLKNNVYSNNISKIKNKMAVFKQKWAKI